MKIFSYVVARDYGFAPNPFFGFCTLATCKPMIRNSAKSGDWVLGTSRNEIGSGRLVFLMQVEEVLTFNEYFNDKRFRLKKPNLNSTLKRAYGDNIYSYKKNAKSWTQLDSHHSYSDGRPNKSNIAHDTQYNKVLVSTMFSYWGRNGAEIPQKFRNYDGHDICKKGPGHRCHFPEEMVEKFLKWATETTEFNVVERPADW